MTAFGATYTEEEMQELRDTIEAHTKLITSKSTTIAAQQKDIESYRLTNEELGKKLKVADELSSSLNTKWGTTLRQVEAQNEQLEEKNRYISMLEQELNNIKLRFAKLQGYMDRMQEQEKIKLVADKPDLLRYPELLNLWNTFYAIQYPDVAKQHMSNSATGSRPYGR